MAGPYELYLIRHGIAEERGDAWPDDSKRPLTAEGTSRLRKSARGLVRLGVAFDVILTSPLVRARETPDVVASVYDPRPHIVTAESLAPGGTFHALLTDLEKQARRTRIALIGHEPGIGELAARLAGSRRGLPVQKRPVCRVGVTRTAP